MSIAGLPNEQSRSRSGRDAQREAKDACRSRCNDDDEKLLVCIDELNSMGGGAVVNGIGSRRPVHAKTGRSKRGMGIGSSGVAQMGELVDGSEGEIERLKRENRELEMDRDALRNRLHHIKGRYVKSQLKIMDTIEREVANVNLIERSLKVLEETIIQSMSRGQAEGLIGRENGDRWNEISDSNLRAVEKIGLNANASPNELISYIIRVCEEIIEKVRAMFDNQGRTVNIRNLAGKVATIVNECVKMKREIRDYRADISDKKERAASVIKASDEKDMKLKQVQRLKDDLERKLSKLEARNFELETELDRKTKLISNLDVKIRAYLDNRGE